MIQGCARKRTLLLWAYKRKVKHLRGVWGKNRSRFSMNTLMSQSVGRPFRKWTFHGASKTHSLLFTFKHLKTFTKWTIAYAWCWPIGHNVKLMNSFVLSWIHEIRFESRSGLYRERKCICFSMFQWQGVDRLLAHFTNRRSRFSPTSSRSICIDWLKLGN